MKAPKQKKAKAPKKVNLLHKLISSKLPGPYCSFFLPFLSKLKDFPATLKQAPEPPH